jgi:chromosome partitioning protein
MNKKEATIIAVVNQKGGVGKTTTTLSLGYGLADKGKKILLVDFDPQSNLTICMGNDDTDSIEKNISSLMSMQMQGEEITNKEDFVMHKDNLDYIPCNIELSAIETSLVTSLSREQQLKFILSSYKKDYDYIFIDCSPSLGMLTINALTAADKVIVPVTCEYLSAKGLELLLKNIIRIKKFLNPNLDIAGIVLTMVKPNTNLAKTVSTLINDAYGSHIKIFNSQIPSSVKMSEASMNNKSIYEYTPKNKVSLAYSELTNEVLKTLEPTLPKKAKTI